MGGGVGVCYEGWWVCYDALSTFPTIIITVAESNVHILTHIHTHTKQLKVQVEVTNIKRTMKYYVIICKCITLLLNKSEDPL